ncbi:hypothetical protein So717_33290 [Roseobacter cerasinus]|uniref:DUF6680 domain-containing protein n=1 Tax=Roseobacter cerasinus TaxID=2602289 RepID=A0A640VZ84_9RHOB|nr:DUF6680 family protein [Roseobacter cerasinus]GFE51576.1 hypothetical protein So717_33290 [Roseobacter cerasinus]
MALESYFTIAAVLLSPLLAVQATKFLEKSAEKRSRRIAVYRTLMATRAQRLSPAHVEALNSIDLEFTDHGDKAIREAWKALLAHFSDRSYPENQKEQWVIRHIDLLVELLFEMGKRMGFEFDKTHIRTGIYSPQAFGDMEEEQAIVRRGVVEVLLGKRAVPIRIMQETHDDQNL